MSSGYIFSDNCDQAYHQYQFYPITRPLEHVTEYFCDRTQFTPLLTSVTYSTDQAIACINCGCHNEKLPDNIDFDVIVIVVSIVGAQPVRTSPSDSSYNVKIFKGKCPEDELFLTKALSWKCNEMVTLEEYVQVQAEFTLNSSLDYVDHPLKHFVVEHLDKVMMFLPDRPEPVTQSYRATIDSSGNPKKKYSAGKFAGAAAMESYSNHFVLISDSIINVAREVPNTAKDNPHIGRKQKKK